MKTIKDFLIEANKYKGNLKKAFEMGYDCGVNGANTTNCHFGLFSSPEMTKAWEEGKNRANKILRK